jgi:SAM-dependent methyltransferase
MSFQDHFSSQSKEYARFRPRYPHALFEWLVSVSPARALAWDCGAGSGQAAVALAEYFKHVVASDPSAEQIAHAEPHPRVQYLVGRAEEPPAAARGADLVTCAQALHWFDHARFYPALRTTLKPDGVFAAWGYGLMTIAPEVDTVVNDYYTNIVGPYWPPDRVHIENRYQSLPFPLTRIAAPESHMTADWSLDALLGYLDTWSATRRFQAARGEHPLIQIRDRLRRAWGEAKTRPVAWPLFIRSGRFSGEGKN